MKRYLLDTGPLAAYLLNRRRAVARIDPLIDAEEVATSIIVYGEVEEYIKTLPNYPALHLDLRRQLRSISPSWLRIGLWSCMGTFAFRCGLPVGLESCRIRIHSLPPQHSATD